jgi:peroxiredoxin
MKTSIYYCLFLILLGCQPAEKHGDEQAAQNIKPKVPNVTVAQLTKSFGEFWIYYSRYAQLSQDLPMLDESGKSIGREIFLEKLNTGLYLALVINEKDRLNFKLALIPKGAPKDIGLITSNYANRELTNYKMEGRPIPKFSFKDLNGKLYTSENTKGKIVLFKCWFIACVACVKEMPALNKLIAKYKDRDDILYISLAIDQQLALKKFLSTTRFDYVTIADQENYMTKDLHVQVYPTHYIINKKGILVKVVDEERVMEGYLEKLAN